jgi:hypothetical protein
MDSKYDEDADPVEGSRMTSDARHILPSGIGRATRNLNILASLSPTSYEILVGQEADSLQLRASGIPPL